MRKLAVCLATAPLLAITACSGATVDSEDVTETATATSTSTSTSTATSTTSTTSTSASASAESRASEGGDQPAREVESVPSQAAAYTAEEQAYLDHLRENGVNIEGVEDQLTATGLTVCANDPITRDAVAGQLVEQRRTDMDAAQVAALISDTARANLCG